MGAHSDWSAVHAVVVEGLRDAELTSDPPVTTDVGLVEVADAVTDHVVAAFGRRLSARSRRWWSRTQRQATTDGLGDAPMPKVHVAELLGIRPLGRDLYEFDSEFGVIRLHDSECRSLMFSPLDRTLQVEFQIDSAWAPSSFESGCVVSLRFDDATVLRWDTESSTTNERARGQVHDLAWDGGTWFRLDLFDVCVEFTSTSAQLQVRSRDAGAADPSL